MNRYCSTETRQEILILHTITMVVDAYKKVQAITKTETLEKQTTFSTTEPEM